MNRNWLELIEHIAQLEERWGRLRVLAELTADNAMIQALHDEWAQAHGGNDNA